jgi:hypothetical protein
VETAKSQNVYTAATQVKAKLLAPKPKHLRIEHVYSQLFYNDKIKPELEKLGLSNKGDEMAARSKLTKKLLDSEDDTVKKQVADERERLYQEAYSKWTEAQGETGSIQQQQMYVVNVNLHPNRGIFANVSRIHVVRLIIWIVLSLHS